MVNRTRYRDEIGQVDSVGTYIKPAPFFVGGIASSIAYDPFIDIQIPTDTQDGDIMVLQYINTSERVTSIPGGWTLIDGYSASYGGFYTTYFWKVASNETSYFINSSASMEGYSIGVYRGIDTVNPIQSYANTNYSVNNQNILGGSVTLSYSNSIVVGLTSILYGTGTPNPQYTSGDFTLTKRTESSYGEISSALFDSLVPIAVGPTNDFYFTAGVTPKKDGSQKHGFMIALKPA